MFAGRFTIRMFIKRKIVLMVYAAKEQRVEKGCCNLC
jgi:hypothetical protein